MITVHPELMATRLIEDLTTSKANLDTEATIEVAKVFALLAIARGLGDVESGLLRLSSESSATLGSSASEIAKAIIEASTETL